MTLTIATTRPTDELDRPDWLPDDQWPFALRRYDHPQRDQDPLAIHYTDEGEGPVLLFVHAGMWSFVWRDVIAELRQDFRCIALDFPGAGLSGGTRNDVDFVEFPGIVSGLLGHCEVDEATWIVHDLGGVVGVVAAAESPERVAGLVAANSFAWRPDRRSLSAMLRVMGSPITTATLGTLRLVPRMSRSSFGVGRHLDGAGRQAFFGPYRKRGHSRNFHRAMRSARSSGDLFETAGVALAGTLDHLCVLTVFGEKNDQFGFAERWRSMFPEATSFVVEGGNHFPMCDDPTGFCSQIRDWHGQHVAANVPNPPPAHAAS